MISSPVAVVTGVSSGIGRATAELFVRKGFKVYGTVRNATTALPMVGVQFVEMDVVSEESVEHAIQTIIDKTGRIDVLINNAGTSLIGAIEETSINEAEALFQTNFFGILRVIRAVLPHMRDRGRGRIINVSSVLGFLPAPYMGLYSASKHAVEGLSESLDHEVRQFGIRVSLVEPTFTNTNLDKNSGLAANCSDVYKNERQQASVAVLKHIQTAAAPSSVAKVIYKAATSTWSMRHTPPGEATVLSILRRFMPSLLVSNGIRKTFGLS